jgi:DNA-binding SARP family transcriptional activator
MTGVPAAGRPTLAGVDRAAGLSVSLLGPFEVRVRGVVVDCGPVRDRTVLAALALDAGRPVPIDELIERVWGGPAGAAGYRALYECVSGLRGVLDDAGAGRSVLSLVAGSGGYQLRVDPGQVDALRFRGLVRAAGAADGAGAAALRALAERLWRGPALAGLTGEWAAVTRRALERERRDAPAATPPPATRAVRPAPA